jgi:sugar/nucleoside kinase (ribokinase family)
MQLAWRRQGDGQRGGRRATEGAHLAGRDASQTARVIVVIGDLVEDVVVRLHGPVAVGDDTPATITRRPGGSAANTAVAISKLGGAARLVAAIGGDDLGSRLTDRLRGAGVDVIEAVVRGARTGSIVVVVDDDGERTMLTDRGCSAELGHLPVGWDAGIRALHVPMYALAQMMMADVVRQAAKRAQSMGASVSVDVSSARLVGDLGGRDAVRALLADLGAGIVLANEQEASALDLLDDPPAGRLTVVKRGARPAVLLGDGVHVEVAAELLDRIVDSTGAGDAFAAGFLVALGRGIDPAGAVRAGHGSAADLLASRGIA